MSGILSVMLGDNGSSAAFTPAYMTGLIGWWKADTGVTTSSGNVTGVADQSGLGNDLVNNEIFVPGSHVPLNATGFNGHPAFDFLAANNGALKVDSFAIGSGNKGSVFVIGQMKTASVSAARAISYAQDAGNADFSANGSAAWLNRNLTGGNGINTYRNGLDNIDTAISLNTNYLLGCIYDGTNVTHYVNATAGSTAAINQNWVSGGTFAIGNAIVPPFNPNAAAWEGPIAEVIVTNADNTADVANIYAYAQAKYGI